ncbi:phosphohydrolase [Burkholderia sp. AU16741]|uniref:phosphonate degradation HD-domain oxygenase n=1 Tax=unclassified Burkholderia TaxID=2613784 RepID=UPI000B79B156|nr:MULTISPECIES: phosphonate degradation HD-domain oxygenase [unclassified Burkholderia]MDN7425466.1 HD domain-containing protein [Burkholderia sp. AU45388]OXI29203.1 phosphohydrolase [Burkholderia sp. AU16741]
MALTVEEIHELYRTHGHVAYSGEPVTQLEHALQSGLLAEESGADEALVAAAFLHDFGHLLNRQGDTPSARGIDDLHQYYVLPFLRPLFADAVLEPIRLHVDAKRCLCRTVPGYFESLSPDSVRSLALQGGIFSDEEAVAFLRRPFAEDALRLRRWDDTAKEEGKMTPDLARYMEIVARQVRAAS